MWHIIKIKLNDLLCIFFFSSRCNHVESDSDTEYKLEYVECEIKWNDPEQIRIWALKHQCSHVALKHLFQILNQVTPNAMREIKL